MPIEFINAVKQIEGSTSVSDVLYTLQSFFTGGEYCLQNISVLSPFVEKLRNTPNSVMALNSFAHALERLDASVYDTFMNQPEYKDVIDLYNNTDRGTDEFRNKVMVEAIANGKSIIDEFEKKTGISLADTTEESLRVYNRAKKLARHASSYADKMISEGTRRSKKELIKYYDDTVLCNFDEKYYFPIKRKTINNLQKFHQFLIDKSSVSAEQAEKWFSQHVKINNNFIKKAEEEGWTEEKITDYIKGLYRITNGLSFDDVVISVGKLKDHASGNTSKDGNKVKIIVNGKRFSANIITHEFGHIIDLCASVNYIAIHQFLKVRSNGKTGRLRGFKTNGYQDKFYTNYAGTVYPVNVTECFSTGLEQIALVNNDSEIFYNFGYKYQAYDPEHLALVIGLLQEKKDIDVSCTQKEIVASNTALARSWMEAVKNAIPKTTYEQIRKAEYSCDKFYLGKIYFLNSCEEIIYIKFYNSKEFIPLKVIKEEQIPLLVYTVWGYCHQIFPFNIFCNNIQELTDLMPFATLNNTYIPFWYTIGMKLPKMR